MFLAGQRVLGHLLLLFRAVGIDSLRYLFQLGTLFYRVIYKSFSQNPSIAALV